MRASIARWFDAVSLWPGPALRWVLAAALVALATALNFVAQPLLGGRGPLLPYFPALILVGILCGPAAGVVALLVSAALVSTFWIEPIGQPLQVARPADLLLLAGFGVAGALGMAVGALARGRLLALRQASRRLETAFDAGRVAAWDWDLSTGEVTVSASGLKLLDTREVNVAVLAELLHRDDRDDAVAQVTAALRDRTRQQFVLHTRLHVPGTRELMWVETRARIERNARGRAQCVSGISSDVTESRRATESVRRSEALLRTLDEAVPDFIWSSDARGAPLHVNRRWCEYTGVTLEGLRECGWRHFHHPDDTDLQARWDAYRATGRTFELQYRYRRHDGVYRWFWARVVPVHNADGELVRWVGTGTDITERLAAQTQVARLAHVIDELPDGVAIAQPDGRLVYLNGAGRALLRLAPDTDPATLQPAQLCPPWVLARARELWLPQALENGSARGEGAVLAADGREIPVAFVVIVSRDSGGAVDHVSLVATDITVQRAADEAHAADARRKDEFLATLAHELRNPMGPIRFAAATLADGEPGSPQQHAKRVIERQSAQMARLLDDLLDMSRIARGAVELAPETLDLRQLVRDAVDGALHALSSRGHRLVLALPPEPVWVHADPARALQVVGNLLDNAGKYTPPRGRVDVTLVDTGGRAVLQVADSGVGIEPGQLARVFDLFARFGEQGATPGSGLGIGLSVVRRLVELHGGRVSAESAGRGRGARFTIELPTVPAPLPAGSAPAARGAPPAADGVPVLVVDDNRDAADSLAALLRLSGYRSRVAYDGAGALAAVAAERPRIAILDLGLPDMSGTDLARRLRAAEPAAEPCTLIALTGWGHASDRQRTHDAGFDAHLVKPVDPDALLALMADARPAQREAAAG